MELPPLFQRGQAWLTDVHMRDIADPASQQIQALSILNQGPHVQVQSEPWTACLLNDFQHGGDVIHKISAVDGRIRLQADGYALGLCYVPQGAEELQRRLQVRALGPVPVHRAPEDQVFASYRLGEPQRRPSVLQKGLALLRRTEQLLLPAIPDGLDRGNFQPVLRPDALSPGSGLLQTCIGLLRENAGRGDFQPGEAVFLQKGVGGPVLLRAPGNIGHRQFHSGASSVFVLAVLTAANASRSKAPFIRFRGQK